MRLLSGLFCTALFLSGCSNIGKDDSDTESGDSELPQQTCTSGEAGIEVDGICFRDYGVGSDFGYEALLAASMTGGDNPPENVIDGYAAWDSRWESSGNQWVELRLPETQLINRVGISFMKGDEYPFIYTITVSVDRKNWVTVYDGQSSGTSTHVEYFYLDTAINANHIRVELNGNTANSMNYPQEIRWGNRSEPVSFPQALTVSNSCEYYNSDPTAIPGTIFLSTFENGISSPEMGNSPLITVEGDASLETVDNPFADSCNGSNTVLEVVSVPNGSNVKTRAEYHSAPRMPLNDRKYIYTWKQYFPQNFLEGADVNWMSFSQWKTWPCGWYDSPSASDYPADSPINYSEIQYDHYICEGAGIFNQLAYLPSKQALSFDVRARPDCAYLEHVPIEEQWNTYILEIHWTNSDEGYFRLFLNGQILARAENFKTLYDFHPGLMGYATCDMYWGLGIYSSWTSSTRSEVKIYLDDIAVYDMDLGATLQQVCPGCVEE